MRTLKLVLALALVSCAPTYAATLTGTVRDAQTGDAVVGANVYLDDTGLGAVADADGAFRIAGVSPGTYTVTASHVGYTVAKRSVAVSQGVVTAELSLEPEILRGQTVVVTASRAKERETPSAFSNLSRQDIERRYWAQDVPMVLQTMPSAHAYSDAGNGVGYSYLSIRGFNQKRINVLINGIPHNGPTSHEVYWIDMPDLLANARDVQIQRGVGSSLHGSSALGGSVNIVTSNFSTQPSVSFHTGAGSYSTRKYSFAYNSGLVAENYVMYGRFSRITSDGYRDQSWTKLWSYFLGVARYDENMTTKIHVYGGPEETHLSYYGIAKEYLDGDITGDARADRRYNPLDYEDETDNFNQPHYEIHNDWQATDRLLVSNIFYTIKGRGDYDQFRRGRSLAEFRLPSFTVTEPDLYETSWYDLDGAGQPVRDGDGRYTIVRTDLIRNRWVENDEYGWIPRLTLDHGNGSFSVGGEVRRHEGKHWGLITWLGATPPGTQPDSPYYRYTENKLTLSAFAREVYYLTPRITLAADLQGVSHTYKLSDDAVTHYRHTTSYRWLAPKAGVNVNLTDRLNVFGNVAYTQREPVSSDLVDPQDYWNTPNFTSADVTQDGLGEVTDVSLSGPTVEPERMVDIELGAGYRSERVAAAVNVYHMDFRNEIVPWVGQINEASGLPATGNADRSVHQGVELELATKPADFLEFSGNLGANNDHFIDYTENAMDWDAWQPVPVERDGNRIAGFPTMVANARALFSHAGFELGLIWRYVGRQYLDNAEGRANSIDPYNVADVLLACDIGRRWGADNVRFEVRVNNVFDTLYAAGGYMDDVYAVASEGAVYGTPYYIPAAPRNVFASVKVDLK